MIHTCNSIVMWSTLQARKDSFINFLLKVIHNILSLSCRFADT